MPFTATRAICWPALQFAAALPGTSYVPRMTPGENPVTERWTMLPQHVRGSFWGIGVGAAIALFTHNTAAGVAVGVILGATALFWSAIPDGPRLLFGMAAACVTVAALCGTARVLTPAPIPDPTATMGYESRSFDCGSVLNHPIDNHTERWIAASRTLVANGMSRPDSTLLLDSCADGINGFRKWFWIPAALAAVLAFGAWLCRAGVRKT